MSSDTVLDRLLLNNGEVPGVVTPLRLPPTKIILPTSLPLAFAWPLGMTQPTPSPSAGRYLVPRRYMIRVHVAVRTEATLDPETAEGARLIAACIPFIDAFTDYYMNHPRLHTAALPDFAGLETDINIIDGGPIPQTGPGGVLYAGVDHILLITERRYSPRLSHRP